MLNQHFHPLGYHRATEQTDLLIGSVNTVLLITSSAVYPAGTGFIRVDDRRRLRQCCVVTALLGFAFLGLKGLEWHEDLAKHMSPGRYFGLSGADAGGAQLFWVFYWVATVLHAVHMVVGIGLLAWLLHRIRKGAYSAAWHTPVEVIGLYWSFGDIVWLILDPSDLSGGTGGMRRILRLVALVWLALMALLGLELGGSLAGLGHAFSGLLLLPAGLMVVLVGLYFMRVRESGGLARFFALAAIFWLVVLLGLGSIDPMTRHDYPVPVTQYP